MTTNRVATTARVLSATVIGVDGYLVNVVAHVGGDPRPHMDRRALSLQATSRVREALNESGLAWPEGPHTFEFVPVDAAAADRAGFFLERRAPQTACDLAIVCATLGAAGALPTGRLTNTAMVGTVAPTGELQWVREVLPALIAARRAGLQRVIVPSAGLPAGLAIPGLEVLGAERLTDVFEWLAGKDGRLKPPGPAPALHKPDAPDLADLVGHPEARWALEVAAAGGHHLLASGRHDVAMTMARCLPGLLPALTQEQALELAAIASQAMPPAQRSPLDTTPPLVVRHSATRRSLFGGKRLGAVSLAHNGVVLLDHRDIEQHPVANLDRVLRDGEISFGTCHTSVRYPARAQVVLALAQCPSLEPGHTSGYAPRDPREHLAWRIGPALDRIELRVQLRPHPAAEDADQPEPESSADVRARVLKARRRAFERWGATNATVSEEILDAHPLRPRTAAEIERNVRSALEATQVRRVAWTIGHLAGLEEPGLAEARAALAFRAGL